MADKRGRPSSRTTIIQSAIGLVKENGPASFTQEAVADRARERLAKIRMIVRAQERAEKFRKIQQFREAATRGRADAPQNIERARQAREEAEEKAATALSDADTQARASREAAEAMAQRIEESARSLEEEVREQERMIRGRMQRYLAALRDVSSQIEEVLGETERGEPALVEALDPERERAKEESRG
jgi:arylsulfatase A-like enzyme